jgi:hypothetical protein
LLLLIGGGVVMVVATVVVMTVVVEVALLILVVGVVLVVLALELHDFDYFVAVALPGWNCVAQDGCLRIGGHLVVAPVALILLADVRSHSTSALHVVLLVFVVAAAEAVVFACWGETDFGLFVTPEDVCGDAPRVEFVGHPFASVLELVLLVAVVRRQLAPVASLHTVLVPIQCLPHAIVVANDDLVGVRYV